MPDYYCQLEADCLKMIRRRGPDLQNCLLTYGDDVRMASSVLWLQGSVACPQPIDSPEACLQWNGDVYRYDNLPLTSTSQSESFPLDSSQCNSSSSNRSDTEFMFAKLRECTTDAEVLDILERVEGPWAFVFLNKIRNILWFGRDFFGRQSLLMSRCESGGLILASCAPISNDFTFVEVAANGLYKVDLKNLDEPMILYPWTGIERPSDNPHVIVSSEGHLVPPVKIICDLKPGPEIDLGDDSQLHHESIFQRLLSDPTVSSQVDELIRLLTEAVRTRISNQPNKCKICIKEAATVHCAQCTCIGVLFSGGLDSAILTFLAAKILLEQSESRYLDLLNVAFATSEGSFDVPDRLTGKQALEEIQQILPQARIRLVEINIGKEELQQCRRTSVSHLLHPLSTVLDDSIGCAIWFAARGVGLVSTAIHCPVVREEAALEGNQEVGHVLYSSPSRVLLSGMGIDEQLGGYSRHRIRFQREGVTGLEKELRMEILRISERNLGRDNRIISDHGVMARFPFLDENLVNYLSSLPTSLKCNFALPRGFGEKLVLRLAAHRLGLAKTAREPKRAVQFGSRIAKLENKKEKAGDLAIRE